MEQLIRAMPPRAEFFVVILVAFGYFLLGSILSLLAPNPDAPISEAGLQFLIVYELVVALVLIGFLWARGWGRKQLGFTPTARDTGLGVGLAVVAYVAYAAVWFLASRLLSGLEEQAGGLVAPGLSLVTVLAVSVLNPIFEEIFVCGYVIAALKKTRSVSFAINVSVGIRLAYHLYQGTIGVAGIIPLGLIFACWFARTGRLWPVIVAHAILDLTALVAYVRL